VIAASAFALDDLERDALTELVNIGVGRAAASLSKMVGDQVMLSVPSVAIVTCDRAAHIIGERDAGRLVAVHQLFEGDISGRALLIFPEANSLELVRAITGGELSLEDVIELEQEALAETGNIILNGCLATIANMLQRSLKMSLPEIVNGSSIELFNLSGASVSEEAVLFLYINFSVHQREIHGYIAMLMDLPALSALKVLIGEMIERAGEPMREADASA
jgi:chemotaxis protein CheC